MEEKQRQRKYLRRYFYLPSWLDCIIPAYNLCAVVKAMREDFGKGWENADFFIRLRQDGAYTVLDFEMIESL